MSNLSYHCSYFGKDQNDKDYHYYQQLYQHIQYQDTIQNQNTGPSHLPNESYHSPSVIDQNDTNYHYYQHLKQCLQYQQVPQKKIAIIDIPSSTTMTQNQGLPTIDHQRLKSVSRSSYEHNRAIPTVITEKSLHNKTASQGSKIFVSMTTSSDHDDAQLPSITAMREYSDKSFEELRLKDYELAYKGKTTSSNDDKKEINDDSLCVVCLEEKKTIIYLPCFHMCTCKKCGMNESLTKCPICRSSIDCKEKVFW